MDEQMLMTAQIIEIRCLLRSASLFVKKLFFKINNFKLFWYVDVKNKLKKNKKNIISVYF